MRHFQIYLKAELGKLSNQGDAQNFITNLPKGKLEQFGVKLDVSELMAQFSSQERVNSFVDCLGTNFLRDLTCLIDNNWRHNGLYNFLSSNDDWNESEISVNHILLRQAEPSLGYLWQLNNYELSRVATDPRVLSRKPYCMRDPGESVNFRICLAKRLGTEYCIIDGVHRAIQLYRNSEEAIQLYWTNEKRQVFFLGLLL